jgi:hypothetical protein
VPGTDEPVPVDTINNGNPSGDATPHNAELFGDNTDGHLDTELDGLTTNLNCRAAVTPNQLNTLSLEIADSTDAFYDSAVFVGAGSIVSSDTAVTTILAGNGQTGDSLTVTPGTAVTDQADLTGINAQAATGNVTYTVFSDKTCSIGRMTPLSLSRPHGREGASAHGRNRVRDDAGYVRPVSGYAVQ